MKRLLNRTHLMIGRKKQFFKRESTCVLFFSRTTKWDLCKQLLMISFATFGNDKYASMYLPKKI